MRQRIVQEEVHHVILGEQLRDRWQFIRADLVAEVDYRLCDPPARIDKPSRGYRRRRTRQGRSLSTSSNSERVSGGRDLQHGIAAPENFWEHGLGIGVDGYQSLPCSRASWRHSSMLIAWPDSGSISKFVLREVAGKEHPVPLLVGDLTREPR